MDDTVAAFDIILHKGKIGETYNIGSPNEFSNLETVSKIIRLIKGPDTIVNDWIEFVEDRPFNDARYFLTYEKLSLLGWKPTIDFDDGLKGVVKWLNSIEPTTYWKDLESALKAHPIP